MNSESEFKVRRYENSDYPEFYIECSESGDFDFTKIYTEDVIQKIEHTYLSFIGMCRCSVKCKTTTKNKFSYEIRVSYLKEELNECNYRIEGVIKNKIKDELYLKIQKLRKRIIFSIKEKINEIVITKKIDELNKIHFENMFEYYVISNIIKSYRREYVNDLYAYRKLLNLTDLKKSNLSDINYDFNMNRDYSFYKDDICDLKSNLTESELSYFKGILSYLEDYVLEINLAYKKIIINLYKILNIPYELG